ncbi:MAG: hypothetical protein ABSH28_24740 [Acidobacteriota bacterium]
MAVYSRNFQSGFGALRIAFAFPSSAVAALRRPRGGLRRAMPFCCHPIIAWPGAAQAGFLPTDDPRGCKDARLHSARGR